eukprot:10727276-Alexandrium_andersonii.AAC.1
MTLVPHKKQRRRQEATLHDVERSTRAQSAEPHQVDTIIWRALLVGAAMQRRNNRYAPHATTP